MSDCPKCGCSERMKKPYYDFADFQWKCGSGECGGEFVESQQCTRNQLTAITAERDKLQQRVKELEGERSDWRDAAITVAHKVGMCLSEEPITEEWLESVGFQRHSLSMSLLIPPVGEGAIVEFSVSAADAGEGPIEEWLVDLTQGLPSGDDQTLADDHVTITSVYPKTRGELRLMLLGLGVSLPPEAAQAESE